MAPVAPQLTKPWRRRVDTDHQGQAIVTGRDVLGGVGHISLAAEFLEADEVGKARAQVEEQIGAGGETVIGAVVDDRGQILAGLRTAEKWALGRMTEPRDSTRGMTIRPLAPTLAACAAWLTAD
jgi:hypothetical protein